MAHSDKIKKFKLSDRAAETNALSVEPKVQLQKALTLAKPNLGATDTSAADGNGNDVVDYLEDAYSPDREQAQQVLRRQKVQMIFVVLGLVAFSILLLIGYAHGLKQWPILEPKTWYLPFVLSSLLSLYMLLRGYLYLKQSKKVLLFVFGLVAAFVLSAWNLKVLRVTAQVDQFSPTNILWLPETTHDMLIAYEVNQARGLGPSLQLYQLGSTKEYKALFLSTPRSEWKNYFLHYLTEEELGQVNVLNIDDTMGLVAGRMYKARVAAWREFEVRYKNPSLNLRLMSFALAPYKLVLNSI